ncbi:UNVERIFIED_CONTAM: hypothetical protein HDU68_002617 [Siphonaria sp. JEL0065]|nr:hypothetical protein HDU68_002617 [Siphonaria sp. JEL0065]
MTAAEEALTAVAAGCDSLSTSATTATRHTNGLPHILVLTAMDIEAEAIINKFGPGHESLLSEALQLTYRSYGKGRRVHVLRCGIAIINAALCVSLFAEKNINLAGIILLGVSGGLSPTLKAGDSVLATKVILHDRFYSRSATDHQVWYVPREADRNLAILIESYLSAPPTRGLMLSGNEFVGYRERRVQLAREFPGALILDMEAGAVAQISSYYKIPWIVLKTVADALDLSDEKAEDVTEANDFMKWIRVSANVCEEVMDGLLKDFGEGSDNQVETVVKTGREGKQK